MKYITLLILHKVIRRHLLDLFIQNNIFAMSRADLQNTDYRKGGVYSHDENPFTNIFFTNHQSPTHFCVFHQSPRIVLDHTSPTFCSTIYLHCFCALMKAESLLDMRRLIA